VRLEGLGHLKNPMISTEIEAATFREALLASFLLGLFFDHEDGSDTLLRNVDNFQ
jgi:hypothetical protein